MRKSALALVIFGWVVGVSLTMAALGAIHNVSFFPDTSLAPSTVSQKNSWTMTHVLGQGCKCSNQVYSYLLSRGPQHNISENIVLVGEMPSERKRLEDRGFHVSGMDKSSIASEKAVGVPFLLITSAKGEAVYAGGYANTLIREGTQIKDLEILSSLRGGLTPSVFPIFGCAVSQRIQSLIDPLHLKYQEPRL